MTNRMTDRSPDGRAPDEGAPETTPFDVAHERARVPGTDAVMPDHARTPEERQRDRANAPERR